MDRNQIELGHLIQSLLDGIDGLHGGEGVDITEGGLEAPVACWQEVEAAWPCPNHALWYPESKPCSVHTIGGWSNVSF